MQYTLHNYKEWEVSPLNEGEAILFNAGKPNQAQNTSLVSRGLNLEEMLNGNPDFFKETLITWNVVGWSPMITLCKHKGGDGSALQELNLYYVEKKWLDRKAPPAGYSRKIHKSDHFQKVRDVFAHLSNDKDYEYEFVKPKGMSESVKKPYKSPEKNMTPMGDDIDRVITNNALQSSQNSKPLESRNASPNPSLSLHKKDAGTASHEQSGDHGASSVVISNLAENPSAEQNPILFETGGQGSLNQSQASIPDPNTAHREERAVHQDQHSNHKLCGYLLPVGIVIALAVWTWSSWPSRTTKEEVKVA